MLKEFKDYLSGTRNGFEVFDRRHPEPGERAAFMLRKKKEIFPRFDFFFQMIWAQAKAMGKDELCAFQQECQKTLHDPLLKAEINRYIKEKPLGYPGDYVMMNYIYDHQEKPLGNSSLDMLINAYTAGIPISRSNILRKAYFKERINRAVAEHAHPLIASIGSGPARELIELAGEGKIVSPLSFSCVDFEERALLHVRSELEKIDPEKRKNLTVRYLQIDIRDLLRDGWLLSCVGEHDLVYAAGLLDYFKKGTARKAVAGLFDAVKNGGELVVVNAGQKDEYFRAYYELLGEWVFFHRSADEVQKWTEGLRGKAELERFSQPMNYHFLKVRKA